MLEKFLLAVQLVIGNVT